MSADLPGIQRDDADGILRLTGSWTTACLAAVEPALAGVLQAPLRSGRIDGSAITHLDTAGAWVVNRLVETLRGAGATVELIGFATRHAALLRTVSNAEAEPVITAGRTSLVEKVGVAARSLVSDLTELITFSGELWVVVLAHITFRERFRWGMVGVQLQQTGPAAVPIVALLSFLVGIVIAYQGGVQLRTYGANAFIVELVTITSVRELAPLLASIIVAGRTGAAFAAELATMNVANEIDAIRTLGMNPVAVLVVPRVFALAITLPLLTACADVASVAGGMVMAALVLDVGPMDFISRIPDAVSLNSFMVGIVKTPVFAMIIAIIGCFQGFQANHGAASVGLRTTLSVVHGIFLIIVADAVFSIFFSLLDI